MIDLRRNRIPFYVFVVEFRTPNAQSLSPGVGFSVDDLLQWFCIQCYREYLGTGAEVLARPLALISSRHSGGFSCRGERKGGREEDEKMRVREGEMRRLRLRGEARRGRKEESEGELCNRDVRHPAKTW